ncbi:hypothetical protein EYF80_047453 [Liparis tanakae]|uniref:Uncharacterized protein n=1 Tax=Liparis tanakae TaxID=230148 RepID=A0A4Z2FMM3_9TELE|nr:hypothetical protein EYF80_047453 [Liparis tanakae]
MGKIKGENRHAASVLEAAGLRTDSEILTLTREDLHELFPGRQAFKLRRTLYDVIHKRPIAEQLLKKLKGFLPRDSFMAALTNNGVLVDYLQILKDTKTQVNSIQSFLDAHIGLLEEFSADQPDSGQTDSCSQEAGEDRSGPSASPPGGQRDGFEHGAGATLLYKMVVGGGKTFGTHQTLMQKVKKPFQERLRPCVGGQDNKITFVFCPISSRVGTDVDAAMVDIKDDKPIILVLMHHTHEVKPVSSMKVKPDDARVVLHVNVFYHETRGLLKCDQNDAAVTEIQNKLEKSFIQRSYDRGGHTQGGGAVSKSADGNYNKLNPKYWLSQK